MDSVDSVDTSPLDVRFITPYWRCAPRDMSRRMSTTVRDTTGGVAGIGDGGVPVWPAILLHTSVSVNMAPSIAIHANPHSFFDGWA